MRTNPHFLSADIILKNKLVILFPSPKCLLGKGYLNSEGMSDDVRNLLETEARARGDFSEENRQLGLCSNIVKVIQGKMCSKFRDHCV